MIWIDAWKAQPIGDEKIDSVTLSLSRTFPGHKSLRLTRAHHKRNAKNVMRALGVLPQGTLHYLLIEMLKAKETFLVIK